MPDIATSLPGDASVVPDTGDVLPDNAIVGHHKGIVEHDGGNVEHHNTYLLLRTVNVVPDSAIVGHRNGIVVQYDAIAKHNINTSDIIIHKSINIFHTNKQQSITLLYIFYIFMYNNRKLKSHRE